MNLQIDVQKVEKNIVDFIQKYVHGNGYKNAILGVSGGLDSAVVASLCVKALGSSHVHALLLPYRTSSPESLEHGLLMCDQLNINRDIINITPLIEMYFDRFPGQTPIQFGNKCARERMAILYDWSVRKAALVAGTSNRSELLMGYFTQYGDSAAAFEPIAELYKTQVIQLAYHLQIPKVIIEKKPSADLWVGQTDEGEMGITYKELDEILYLLEDKGKDATETAIMGFALETVQKVQKKIETTQFKRVPPPVAECFK